MGEEDEPILSEHELEEKDRLFSNEVITFKVPERENILIKHINLVENETVQQVQDFLKS